MRRISFLIIAILAMSSFVFADEWNKTYNITGKPTLKVETSDAAIQVTAWDKPSIAAHVATEGYKIGPDGIRIVEHQTGNVVELEVRFPHREFHFGFSHTRVDIEVQVPREATVALRTGDGRIRVSGIKGNVDTWSGDGSQEINAVDGILRAHTGDGHITASGRFDGLELNTGDGPIETTAIAGSKVAQDWLLRTGDGSITLRVPEKLAADVDLHTNDGHINLDLPVEVSGRMGSNNIRGRLNGGGRLLSIRTGDGSITLERS